MPVRRSIRKYLRQTSQMVALFVALYLMSVGCGLIVRWMAFRRICLKDSAAEPRHLSIAWSWLDHGRLRALYHLQSRDRLIRILEYPDWSWRRALLPHVAILTAATLFYQAFLRKGGLFDSGPCPASPNCSAYFLGAIHRFPFPAAMLLSAERIRNCNAAEPESLEADFFKIP